MSLPRAAERNNREEVERLLRSGSDVNERLWVRYNIKHATHKFVYIFVIYIITSYETDNISLNFTNVRDIYQSMLYKLICLQIYIV